MNVGRESETVEFKVSTSELDDALVDIVAILNKRSKGKLYFGVKNNYDVCGFQIGSSTERDISRRIYESIRPQIVPTIETKRIQDKFFVEVDFSGNAKPYSTDGRYYVRSSDESREMSPTELARFILNQNYSSWEATPSDCIIDSVMKMSCIGNSYAHLALRENIKYCPTLDNVNDRFYGQTS